MADPSVPVGEPTEKETTLSEERNNSLQHAVAMRSRLLNALKKEIATLRSPLRRLQASKGKLEETLKTNPNAEEKARISAELNDVKTQITSVTQQLNEKQAQFKRVTAMCDRQPALMAARASRAPEEYSSADDIAKSDDCSDGSLSDHDEDSDEGSVHSREEVFSREGGSDNGNDSDFRLGSGNEDGDGDSDSSFSDFGDSEHNSTDDDENPGDPENSSSCNEDDNGSDDDSEDDDADFEADDEDSESGDESGDEPGDESGDKRDNKSGGGSGGDSGQGPSAEIALSAGNTHDAELYNMRFITKPGATIATGPTVTVEAEPEKEVPEYVQKRYLHLRKSNVADRASRTRAEEQRKKLEAECSLPVAWDLMLDIADSLKKTPDAPVTTHVKRLNKIFNSELFIDRCNELYGNAVARTAQEAAWELDRQAGVQRGIQHNKEAQRTLKESLAMDKRMKKALQSAKKRHAKREGQEAAEKARQARQEKAKREKEAAAQAKKAKQELEAQERKAKQEEAKREKEAAAQEKKAKQELEAQEKKAKQEEAKREKEAAAQEKKAKQELEAQEKKAKQKEARLRNEPDTMKAVSKAANTYEIKCQRKLKEHQVNCNRLKNCKKLASVLELRKIVDQVVWHLSDEAKNCPELQAVFQIKFQPAFKTLLSEIAVHAKRLETPCPGNGKQAKTKEENDESSSSSKKRAKTKEENDESSSSSKKRKQT